MSTTPRSKPVPHAQSARLPSIHSPRGFKAPTLLSVQRHTPSNREVLLMYHNDLTKLASIEEKERANQQKVQSARALTIPPPPSEVATPPHTAHSVHFAFESTDPSIERVAPTVPVEKTLHTKPTKLNPFPEKPILTEYEEIKQRIEAYEARYQRGNLQRRMSTIYGKQPSTANMANDTASGGINSQSNLTSDALQEAFAELKFSFLNKVVLEKEEKNTKKEEEEAQKLLEDRQRASETARRLKTALHADHLKRFLLPKYQQSVRHHIGAARDEQTRSTWMTESLANTVLNDASLGGGPYDSITNIDSQKHKRSMTELINWLCRSALESLHEDQQPLDVTKVSRANAGKQLFRCFELCTDLCNFVLCKILPPEVFAGDGDRYKALVQAALVETEREREDAANKSPLNSPRIGTTSTISPISPSDPQVPQVDDGQTFSLTRVPKPPTSSATNPLDIEKKQSTRMRAERALAGVAKARLQELVPMSKNEHFVPDDVAIGVDNSDRKYNKHMSSINQTLQAAADRHGLWLSLCSPRLAHPPLHACSHLDGRKLRDEQKFQRQVVAITGGQPPTATVGTETSAEAKSKATADHVARNAVTDIEDFHKPDDTILPIVELLQDMATALSGTEGQAKERVVGRQTGPVEGALLSEIAHCYCSFVKAVVDPELRAPKRVEDIHSSERSETDPTEAPRCVFAKRHMIVATAPRLIIDATINYLKTLVRLPSAEEDRAERRHRKLLEYSITGEFRDPALVDADVEAEISTQGRRGYSSRQLLGSQKESSKEAALKQVQSAAAAAATSQQEKERMEMLAEEQNTQLLSEILIRLRGELLFLFTGVDERQHFIEEHQRKERQRWEALDARRRQRQQQQQAKQLALLNSKKAESGAENSPAPSHRSLTATASNRSSKDAPPSSRGRRGSFLSGPANSIAALMDDLKKEDEEAVAAMMLLGAQCGGVSVTGVSELSHQAQLRHHKQKMAEKEGENPPSAGPNVNNEVEGGGIRIVIEPSVADIEIETPAGVFPLPPKAAVFEWQNSHRAITPSHPNGKGAKATRPEVGSNAKFMKPTVSSANSNNPGGINLSGPQLQTHTLKLPGYQPMFGSSSFLTTGNNGKGRSPSVLGSSYSATSFNPLMVTKKDEEAEMQSIANELLQLERHRRRHNPTLLLQHPTAQMTATVATSKREDDDQQVSLDISTVESGDPPKRPPPLPTTFDKELTSAEVEKVRRYMTLSAREQRAMDKGAISEMSKLQSPKAKKELGAEDEPPVTEGVGPIVGRYQYHAKEGCYYFPLNTDSVKVDPKTGEQAKVVKLVSVTQSVVGVKEAEAVERFKQACKQTLPGSDIMTRWYEHKSDGGAFRKYKDEKKDTITIEAEKHLTNAAQPSGSTNTLQRGTFDVHGASPLTVLWTLANDHRNGAGTWRGKPLSINWTF